MYDYTYLNKACSKDSYPLSSIDRLVNGSFDPAVMSFLYAYSSYNQIQMYKLDITKTSFTTEMANYCYKVMSFGLKNVGVMYLRLMDKVFKEKNWEKYGGLYG